MITGIVNEDFEAILRLSVHGAGGTPLEIDAVIDTGFNGYLTLPPDLVEKLKLPWLYRQQGELADGSIHVFDVHTGAILWAGRERMVEVEVAETEPLLGMAMLQMHNLNIEVVSGGSVTITEHTG